MKIRRIILFFLYLFIAGNCLVFNASAQSQVIASQSFPRNLAIGDAGSDVASLQAFLISHNFLEISGPTGVFGELTSAAVAKWQTSADLPATGYFGSLSRLAIEGNTPVQNAPINSVPQISPSVPAAVVTTSTTLYNQNLSIGATGAEVVSLQSFLIANGFLAIAGPTGVFGKLTSAAVAKWQTSADLPATGYFGTLSRADLDTATSSKPLAQTSVPTASIPLSTLSVRTSTFVASTHTTVNVNLGGGGGGGGNSSPQIIAPPAPQNNSDTTPPTISMTDPVTNSTITGTVSVAVSASDNIGVTKVEFYVDGIFQTLATVPPYVFSLNTNALSDGPHVLTAKAYDAAGNIGIAGNTTISVVPPAPTVPLGLTVTGSTSSSILLSWDPSTELGGSIAGYQLYQGSTQIATTTTTFFNNTELTASTTYSYSVDSYDLGGIISATSTSVTTTTLSPPPLLNYNFGLALGENPVYMSSSTLNQELNNIESLGVGWIRFDMEWNHVQPNNSSTYDWSLIDPVVAAAEAHHIKVLAILDFTPTWAASSSCGSENNHCAPADPNAFATFAAAAVQRYSSQGVSDWEIWNEPNNSEFWGPTTDCNAYAALLQATYPAIKAVDPNATVITGGLSPAATDGVNMSPPDFLSCIYAVGGENYFDAVGDHPYTFPSFPSNDGGGAWNQMAVGTDSLRGIMVANGDSNKQIWATEFGTPTDGPDPDWYVSEAQQSQMMTDAITTYSTYSWAGPFFWYTYQDSGASTSTSENFFGLLRADGSTKPAYQTLQTLISAQL